MTALSFIADWYFEHVYAKVEGPGIPPFYTDRSKVGHFAVSAEELATGNETALFRLLISFSMFQARRDVLVMARQRSLPLADVKLMSSGSVIASAVRQRGCTMLESVETLEDSCDVKRTRSGFDCGHAPGATCIVKDLGRCYNRMGDMGKIPVSAWFRLSSTGLHEVFESVTASSPDPAQRAGLMVKRVASIFRIGEKLATMFVSALSTPALAPGLCPWHPALSGDALVVIDTNAIRVVDALARSRGVRTYSSRAAYLTRAAAVLAQQRRNDHLPRLTPRLLQQAIYWYGSKSNRRAIGDECTQRCRCPKLLRHLCPFA